MGGGALSALAAIATLLREDPAVAALVAGRIYIPEIPQAAAGDMPRASIVVAAAGGAGSGQGASSRVPWRITTMEVACYGKTPAEAMAVHEAVYALMTQIRRVVKDDSMIYDATVIAGPEQGRDPDADWPMVLGVYSVNSAPA